jgi:hypothetical protein
MGALHMYRLTCISFLDGKPASRQIKQLDDAVQSFKDATRGAFYDVVVLYDLKTGFSTDVVHYWTSASRFTAEKRTGW